MIEHWGHDAAPILLPALDQAIAAIVMIDETGHFRFFNKAAERLWGWRREDVLGRPVQMLVSSILEAGYGDDLSRDCELCLKQMQGSTRELLMRRKDGASVWVSLSVTKGESGDHADYMVFAHDISDDVMMRTDHRWMAMVVNNTDRPVLVLDHERRVVYANQAFTRLFGYGLDEIVGTVTSFLLASARGDPGALARFRINGWKDEPFQDEILAMNKQGQDIWMRIFVSPVFDKEPQRRLTNLVVIMSDITQERQIRDLQRDALAALTSGLSFELQGDYLCRRIEAIVPGVAATLTRVEDSRLRPWAAPSFPAEYLADLDGVPIGEGVANCGTAAYRGEPVVVNDIDSDPLWAPFKHKVLQYGFFACWSYPIKRRDGQVVGTFAFYFRRQIADQAYLKQIATEIVYLCALAIEHEESRRQITRLAQFDVVTGLPNRHRLLQHLDQSLANHEDADIAVLCLGLDRFKDVNDTLGHMAGDSVLAIVGSRLQSILAQDEFISRTEGDLFVIVVSGHDVHRASHLVERLQAVMDRPIEVEGLTLHLSASVGISHAREGGHDRETLLNRAKSALYRAKLQGLGQYQFFSPAMHEQARDRLLLGSALKRAIAEGKLSLCYQPQVYLENRQLYGVEALARWHDPELGEISPYRFISLAEDIGEIEAIGRWSLREACRQMAQWRDTGIPVPVVSVNLTPSNFASEDLPDLIESLLDDYQLPGHCLTIEITERTMMGLTTEMQASIHRIRGFGVGLAVDDFGTGFSNLANLANLPVTEMKIDHSFISRCLTESRLQTLVIAVIGIGRSLALTVVAEGVENEAQQALLEAHQCPVVQGFLIAEPLLPAQLRAFLEVNP